jgi:hypothetical protein
VKLGCNQFPQGVAVRGKNAFGVAVRGKNAFGVAVREKECF